MPADTHGPFPFEAVRDLLGIARALYRASSDEPQRQAEIARIGRGLREALDLAKRCADGTMGRRAAWQHAERATRALGEVVADGCAVARWYAPRRCVCTCATELVHGSHVSADRRPWYITDRAAQEYAALMRLDDVERARTELHQLSTRAHKVREQSNRLELWRVKAVAPGMR